MGADGYLKNYNGWDFFPVYDYTTFSDKCIINPINPKETKYWVGSDPNSDKETIADIESFDGTLKYFWDGEKKYEHINR